MISRSLEDVIDSITRLLPSAPADLERNVRAALVAAFERLDLVTREELEVQEAVLQRTRARVAQLERKVTELEILSRSK